MATSPGLRGLGTETIYSFIYRARQKVEKRWRLTLAAKLAGKSAAETAATLMASSSDWRRSAKARSRLHS